MASIANAAEDSVSGIEFKYDEADYDSSSKSLIVWVEDGKTELSLYASVSGSSTQQDVTANATWKSSNSSVVKVDKGQLTGISKGTATISATYKGYTVSIKAASDYVYDQVTLTNDGSEAPASIDLELGQSLVLGLTGSKNGSAEDVASDAVWTTTNSSVATVDEGTVTLVGTGTATISAKLKGKSDSIKLKVTSPYQSISIAPVLADDLLEMEVGEDEYSLTASVIANTGETIDVTDKATWTSGNAKIAAVEKGKVTAVAAGQTKITVAYMGVSKSINIIVRTAYQAMKLTPGTEVHLLLHDEPLQIEAQVQSNAGTAPITVTETAEWKSSNVVVATVSGGKVTPKAVGTTKITASYKGVSRSVDVTVYPSVEDLSVDAAVIDAFMGDEGKLPKVTGTTFDGQQVDMTELTSWSSDKEEIVAVENGSWTAKALGEAVLTAKVDDLKVQVPVTVHMKPLKLIPEVKDMSVILGQEVALPSVTVINADGVEEDVTGKVQWKVNSDNVVLKNNTIKGIEASTVTLTATYLNKTATVKVKIEQEIVKLVVEPAVLELNPGRSKSIKVTGYYKDGSKVSLGSKMNWTVSSEALATVKGATVKALAVGSGQVTGTYQDKTVTVKLVVTPKLKSLVLSEKSAKLSPGATFAVKLQANYTTGESVDVTSSAVWTTSKSSVATVKDGIITAVAKGSSTVKATFEGKTVTFRVTVK
ncbi:Ig-like domain-containing protein [Paenibacillus thailandensis]|uniref:Ig-like domain-containing protein n=1 Tax=Paenibacillus thailandensis TaxID=393250 RepID=A0ABW5QYR8_9BACL